MTLVIVNPLEPTGHNSRERAVFGFLVETSSVATILSGFVGLCVRGGMLDNCRAKHERSATQLGSANAKAQLAVDSWFELDGILEEVRTWVPGREGSCSALSKSVYIYMSVCVFVCECTYICIYVALYVYITVYEFVDRQKMPVKVAQLEETIPFAPT